MFQQIHITQMNQIDALEIANHWKYPKPYDFYDMTADPEDYEELMDEIKRQNHYFSVSQQQILSGFFCVFPKNDSWQEVEVGCRTAV